MVKTQDIIAAVSTVTGLGVDEVAWLTRKLREEDLFVRQTKSPRSWKMAYRDAANLLAGILSGASALQAAAAVRKMHDCIITPDCQRTIESVIWPCNEFGLHMSGEHNIIDAIEAFVHVFVVIPKSEWTKFDWSQIRFERNEQSACVSLHYQGKMHDPGPDVAGYDFFYTNPEHIYDRHLFDSRTLDIEVIKAVARVFRND